MSRTTTLDTNDLKSRRLGLTRSERQSYSIGRAIRTMIQGCQLTGIEKELHDECAKEMPQKSSGFFLPLELLENDSPRRRDLNVTTFGQGGALVQTSVRPEVVPILRNACVSEKLGVRFVTGLEGNVAFPRQTASITPSALGEQVAAALQTQVLDQILIAPHRVSALCKISRQLILQSSVDAEEFLKDDIAAALAVQIDQQILTGDGGAQCTGILNTTGVGSIQFGGQASWQSLVAFETALANANALGRPNSRVGWAVSPSTKARWKVLPKNGPNVTSVVPIFLWDDLGNGTEDGKVNGYIACPTNQVSNNNLAYFGNWADAICGVWGRGGVADVIVDVFSAAETATIRIILNTFFDLAVLHPQSFLISMDSGAQ